MNVAETIELETVFERDTDESHVSNDASLSNRQELIRRRLLGPLRPSSDGARSAETVRSDAPGRGQTDRSVTKGESVRSAIPAYVPTSRRSRASSFTKLQEWEGYVSEVKQDVFVAHLCDLTAGSNVEAEEVELPISDLSQDDTRLLKVGAILRWVIGYERKPGGTKQRVSRIVFRRLPQWTARELKNSDALAAEIANSIKAE